MLGLALAVAHWAIKHLDLAVTVLASVNALAGIIASRALDSRSRIPKWAAYGGFVAVFSFTVLAVVGYAAGIHYS
jgi:hypothetical protein